MMAIAVLLISVAVSFVRSFSICPISDDYPFF